MCNKAKNALSAEKLNHRNVNLDIIRSVAVFFVISVHFFLYNGFYSTPIAGEKLFIATFMRTFFRVCVPLFMLLTGYLMNKKQLSEKYYGGLLKTLLTYLFSALLILVYCIIFLRQRVTFADAVFDILGFTHYSWYIEMYIGLFLIIPFLNIIYNNLESKKQKLFLIAVLVVLTVLPSVFNIFDFNSERIIFCPTEVSQCKKLIPEWWVGIYPVTYYFLGAFISEYNDGIRLSSGKLFLIFVTSAFIFGCFNYWSSYGVNFIWGKWNDWFSFQNLFDSVIFFLCLIRLNTERIPLLLRKVFYTVSELSLGAYLLSWIFDNAIYRMLGDRISVVGYGLCYFPITVTAVFFCSLALSFLVKLACKPILKFLRV